MQLKNLGQEVYFVFFLSLLAIALPLSNFLISVSQIGLLICWIFLPNIKQRIKSATQNIYVWIFSSVYLLHLIGLLWASDLKFGFNDLRIKLPILILPIVIGSIAPLNPKHAYLIIKLFIVAVFISTLISILVLLGISGKEVTDVRQISILISHIRLSLLVCLSLFFLLYFLFSDNSQTKLYKALTLALIVWFTCFLFILSSLNGLFILLIMVSTTLVWILISKSNYKWRVIILFAIIATLIGSFFAINTIKLQYFSLYEKDLLPKNIHTKNGRAYTIEGDVSKIENGYHVAWYHCKPEYEKEWNLRSRIHIDSLDLKQQYIRFTLHRYLTSRGLKKDSVGIWNLSESDILNIENGITNYKYSLTYGIKSRLYQIFYELEAVQNGSKPQGHSLGMRFYLWKAGLTIWKNNFWFGVGQGDIDQELNKA